MNLSSEQDAALDKIARWRKDSHGNQEFLLAGYAGTGKTTLLQHFINGLSKEVMCLTPTGKAANILQKKLNDVPVSTIHKALYIPVPPSRNRLKLLETLVAKHPESQKLKDALKHEKERLASNADLKFSPKLEHAIQPGQLVVVDEASMVTRFMRQDLLATQAKILYVGDPGQLPPVKDSGFFQTTPPDAMLEHIHRQALDSPIVRLSLAIRTGEPVGRLDDPECRRVPRGEMAQGDWLETDQVLTGANETRRKLNRYFRRQLGFEDWKPKKGDKLICLKNYLDEEISLVNGGMGEATADFFTFDDEMEVWGDVKVDEGAMQALLCNGFHFKRHYDDTVEREAPEAGDNRREFDYGYAITVHKSQGSEWDSVVIADDGMWDRNPSPRKRWLYTAVTRARKKLTWLY